MRTFPVVLALAALPLVARAELSFPVPAGWLDLSASAPEENFRNIPPELVQMGRSGQFKAFAFDVGHTVNGFTPNLNAVAVNQKLRVRESDVEEAAAAIFGSVKQQLPGARLLEKGILEVGGVNALRLVYDNEMGGRALR